MYQQESEGGYLTICYRTLKNDRNITVKVDDANLQNSLSEAKLDDVIGVNLTLTIPSEILKEQHIDVDNFKPLEHLNYDVFDDYLTLQDVFYK